MCGIIGTTNLDLPIEFLKKGLTLMDKRGPDNNNLFKDGVVHFGHTRLAILDLEERSNQPFEYSHKNKCILLTFNGEIYNYLELRKELLILGYKFKTNSDTEVVAASFIEWGASCFNYFIGMWALAVKFESKLILSRDRVGKKPLYYSTSMKNEISFSSSIKALSIITGDKDISKDGLELYFALGFIPKNHTILRNIFKIEPGQVKVFSKKDNGFILTESTISKLIHSSKGRKKSFKKLFQESVERRVLSDVPIATLMSGGVDSTIVSVITKSILDNTEAFFVDFEDKRFSEKKWADYLSKRNSINLSRVLMNYEDLMVGFKSYYDAYEEPFADYSGIPTIALFKKVSNKYKVVLTGDGGDELFFGYPHYLKKAIIYKLFWVLKLFNKIKFIPKSIKNIICDKKENFESNYLKNHGIITKFTADLINKEFNKSITESGGFLRGLSNYDRTFNNWPEKYLVKVDRASMFNSVEVRSPFLDEQILLKVDEISLFYLFTPFAKKLYLKVMYFKLFGFKYLFAKKHGFIPPLDKLRNEKFSNENFIFTKERVLSLSLDLHKELSTITFEDLKKDKILFDRFFFFHEWIKINKNIYNV
jgi:asparagine synthase (glutamine-hydrolysing)